MKINIVLPILNEERRLEKGCIKVYDFMEKNYPNMYNITIMDNGSTDKSEIIANELVQKYATVNYRKLSERGVGIAFKTAILENDSEIVGYMDVDISTKIEHMAEVMKLFEKDDTQIVNGSRLSKGSVVIGKKFTRNVTSYGLKYLLKIIFGMKINDCICGFKFFRKEIAEKLIILSSDEKGWFLCIEMLLRAERLGITITEIPVVWQDDYDTKVNPKKVIANYLKCIYRLFKEFHFSN